MYLVTARGSATYPVSTAVEAVKMATELESAGKTEVTILAADGKNYKSDNFSELLGGGNDASKPNA